MSKNVNKTLISKNLKYYKDIIELMPGHVFWKDKNGVFMGCNLQQAKDAGFNSTDEIIGKTDYELPWGIQGDYLRKIDREIMKSKKNVTLEELFELPDGTKKIYLSSKQPLYDENNQVSGILGISFDITEKKKLDQELSETKHKLEGMALISSIIAHELRTPLAAIHMAAEGINNYFPALLKGYKLAESENLPVESIRPSQFDLLTSVLADIIKEVNYSNTIINMMLTNVEQLFLNQKDFEVCSISDCINEALQRYPFQEGEKDLVQWNDKNDFNFSGKKILTVHVIFNLFKNALYYIRAANKEKRNVQIWLEKGNGYNKVHFKDTGGGIAADILPNIFDLFFSKTRHGSGVGLAFCKMVMESYSGKIECESIEEEFTEFILSFPVISGDKKNE